MRYTGEGEFEVPGIGSFRDRNDMVFSPVEFLLDTSALSVRDALRLYIDDWSRESVELWLSPDAASAFDEDMSSVLDTVLRCDAQGLTILVVTGVDPWDDEATARLHELLEPLGARLNVSIRLDCDGTALHGNTTLIEIAPRIRRRTVADLLEIADQFSALTAALDGDGLTPASAAGLLRGRHATALLGRCECEWLEVKRRPPLLNTPAQKLGLAKHVAAFANAPAGGLIGYGLATRGTTSGDVIERVTPFPSSMISPVTMRAVIRGRVYPPPVGISVEAIAHDGGMATGLIHVPPQPDERKPFVVRGRLLDGKLREHYVGIPVRVGEDTQWDDLAGIHSLLVAGRAALSLAGRDDKRGASGRRS